MTVLNPLAVSDRGGEGELIYESNWPQQHHHRHKKGAKMNEMAANEKGTGRRWRAFQSRL